MGYESKVFVAIKHDRLYPCAGKPWCEVIAMFDLCKMNYDLIDGVSFRDLFNEPVGCMYADDGNTELERDFYGDPVEGAPIQKVIDWLRKWLKTHDWCRAKALLSTLLLIAKEYDGPGELYCYHFGY